MGCSPDQDRTEIKLRLESGDVSIISRRTWGARNSSNSLADLPNPKRITIHHTVFPTLSAAASQADEQTRMRALQSSHMDRRVGPFSDIGYHYVIMPSGRIYEGRPNGKKGAHDTLNDGFGIAMEGSFQLSGSRITDQQFNSVVALCTQLCKRMGISDPTTLVSTPIKKRGKPSPVNLPRIVGHEDRGDTACPGMPGGTSVRLDEIRQAVKKALL